MKTIVRLAAAVLFVAALSACGSSHKHHQYSAVYVSQDGNAYTRCYDSSSDAFIWYVLVYQNNNQLFNTMSTPLSTSGLSSSSWKPSPAPPSDSTKTNNVVEEDEQGAPGTDSLETTADVSSDDVVTDETTTDTEVTDVIDNSSDPGDPGGGDPGGDPGGSDGGDAGGGDAGGGGE